MCTLLRRALAAGLSLVLATHGTSAVASDEDGDAAAARRRNAATSPAQVQGAVDIPFMEVAPGTPQQQLLWFPRAGAGFLARGEELTRREVEEWVGVMARGAAPVDFESLAERVERVEQLEEWERRLWREYLKSLGPRAKEEPAGSGEVRVTAEVRRTLALRVALGALLPGLAEGLLKELSPGNLLLLIGSAAGTYCAMWLVPEPITKVVALGVSLVMLVAFGAELLAHVALEWKALGEATAKARTFEEVRKAGERFGRALGEDGARVLVVLAAVAVGKDVGPLLKRMPKAPVGGPAWVASLPGVARVRVPVPAGAPAEAATASGVKSMTVLGDRFIITLASSAGGAGAAGGGGPSAAGTPGTPPRSPSSKRLAANMEAAGMHRPPDTAAHHMVAGEASVAAPARRVMQRFGIDLDDAANGVFLPANRMVSGGAQGATHSTLHTDAYYAAVNRALERANSRREVLEILKEIRQQLMLGKFP